MITNALYLPAPDIEALVQGREIVALPQLFLNPGRSFALCPSPLSSSTLPDEKYYRSSFLPIAKTALSKVDPQTALIKAWAKCEGCKGIARHEDLEPLSKLTIWTQEALEKILLEREHIFLAFLRVHLLPNPISVATNHQGHFLALPDSQYVSDSSPVVETSVFLRRKKQIEVLEPPSYPELEELQSKISQLQFSNLILTQASKSLQDKISAFLGWSNLDANHCDSEIAWVKTISTLADRSKEDDDGKKSNYQAGTDFENIVRKSLSFLGFTVDEAYNGKAGGLDLFCSKPYPLAGECKAGKTVPDRSVEELDRIGKRHLKDDYMLATRLIIGAGQPSKQLQESSQTSQVSIINAMTLQELVELQAKHPNSVDLIELKKYLQPGQADYKVKEYIDKVFKELQIRKQVVQSVKEVLNLEQNEEENQDKKEKDCTAIEVRAHYNAKYSPRLNDSKVRDILVELSSPLAGYLGRNEEAERFYFLRDLIVD